MQAKALEVIKEEKKVKKEAEKKGVDPEEMKKILADNDKLWQDKMGQALNDFKDKMKKT